MNILLSLLVFALSVSLSKCFCILAQNTRLMDNPNERSMHSTATVRGGGVIFIGLALLSVPVLCYYTHMLPNHPYILGLSIISLSCISFMDDLYQLSARVRLLVQCGSSALIAVFLRPEELSFAFFAISNSLLISVFLFLAVIWAINHFNFMDGLDGFCALQAIFLLSVYAFLFSLHPALIYQDFCMVLILGLAGFLVLNFPPAKMFMGDVGSASLGLITFILAVIGQQEYQIPIVYWFILNGLFLFDATLTLIRRMFHNEKWFAAHKKHAYQRLKQSGVNSQTILLGQLVLNGIFLLLLLLLQMNELLLYKILATQIGIMLILYAVVEKRAPMFS